MGNLILFPTWLTPYQREIARGEMIERGYELRQNAHSIFLTDVTDCDLSGTGQQWQLYAIGTLGWREPVFEAVCRLVGLDAAQALGRQAAVALDLAFVDGSPEAIQRWHGQAGGMPGDAA